MKLRMQLLAGVAVATGTVAAMPAYAQQTLGVETVIVTGVRASVESALDIKKDSTEIVDSIVATDIGKLPDTTVADTLQRISGIQIKRDLGEGGAGQNSGSGVAIRGLQQVLTTVNGHEVLSASGFRSYNVEDMPTEMVAGVDVYKTSSANLTEGGLGGIINIRTLKPFDFDGLEVVGNLSGNYGDLAKSVRPSASLLVSDRWQTGMGEMGVLIDVTYQDRALRQDYATAGAPTASTTAIPGQKIYVPSGVYNSQVIADRPRYGLNGSFQWKLNDDLEFYADANDNRLMTFQNQPTFAGGYGAASLVVPGSYTLFPGTNYMEKGSFGPIPAGAYYGFTSIMAARDSTEFNQDYTVGAKWHPLSNLTVDANVNYQHSKYQLSVAYGYLSVAGATINYDLSGSVPAITFTGPDLSNINNYVNTTVNYVEQLYGADTASANVDAQWITNLGPINEIDFGVRYNNHDSTFNQTGGYYLGSSIPASAQPNDFEYINTHSFQGTIVQTTQFWVMKPDVLRSNFADEGVLVNHPTTPSFTQANHFGISERVTDGYAEAKFTIGDLDGNFGARISETNRSATGTLNQSGTLTPITYHTDHTDFLPSVNLVYHLTEEMQARFAASRTMTRPDFSSMNPNTILIVGSLSGSKGNINLPAMYASNYDLSLEDYFAPGGAVYVDGFIKTVHNFPYSTTTQEVFGGQPYQISEQLASSVGGTISGFEFGYSQFFDTLPGIWKGLGVQATYTFVDSSQPYYIGGTLAQTTTLPNLSRHNFSLIGMYDLKPVSVRVAYTWRSNFLQSLYTGLAGGNVPQEQAAYGWLDASFNYDFSEHLEGYFQAVNILGTVQHTYTGSPYSPSNYWNNDREFIVGLHYKM